MSSFTLSLSPPAPTLQPCHLHTSSDAQTTIYNASPHQPHSEYPKDCTNPHFAVYTSPHIHLAISPSYILLSRLGRFSAFHRPWFFVFFCIKPYVPRVPRRDPSKCRLYEHGIWYLSDTARNRTRNLFPQMCADSTRPQWWMFQSNMSTQSGPIHLSLHGPSEWFNNSTVMNLDLLTKLSHLMPARQTPLKSIITVELLFIKLFNVSDNSCGKTWRPSPEAWRCQIPQGWHRSAKRYSQRMPQKLPLCCRLSQLWTYDQKYVSTAARTAVDKWAFESCKRKACIARAEWWWFNNKMKTDCKRVQISSNNSN